MTQSQDVWLGRLYREAPCVFFDCDGVIFDSNRFKIEVMQRTLHGHSSDAVREMTAYWNANAGVSRYVKFKHFYSKIAPSDDVAGSVREATRRFEIYSRAGYASAQPITAALALAEHAGKERCWVISGADQQELREVFESKGLDRCFAGVFGSPQPKEELIGHVLARTGADPAGAFLIGDGAADYRACAALGVHFVFLAEYSAWTEAQDVLRDAPRVTWVDTWARLLKLLEVNAC
jgi:phosphoglycolate phosphatase-like HAD superfamily hydrolase